MEMLNNKTGGKLPRKLIGLAEAAELLSISPSKLYRLAKKEGKIGYVQYTQHGEILFEPEEVLRFFQQSKFKASAPGEGTPETDSPKTNALIVEHGKY